MQWGMCALLSHRTIERPGLQRTTVLIEFQPPAVCRVSNHQPRLPRATSSLALNACRDGASAASLGNLWTVRHHPLGEKLPPNIQPKSQTDNKRGVIDGICITIRISLITSFLMHVFPDDTGVSSEHWHAHHLFYWSYWVSTSLTFIPKACLSKR